MLAGASSLSQLSVSCTPHLGLFPLLQLCQAQDGVEVAASTDEEERQLSIRQRQQ